jgi:hypothetical protein
MAASYLATVADISLASSLASALFLALPANSTSIAISPYSLAISSNAF